MRATFLCSDIVVAAPSACFRRCGLLLVVVRHHIVYFAEPPVEQVLQVFVQQTLTTSYQTSTWTFTDFREFRAPEFLSAFAPLELVKA